MTLPSSRTCRSCHAVKPIGKFYRNGRTCRACCIKIANTVPKKERTDRPTFAEELASARLTEKELAAMHDAAPAILSYRIWMGYQDRPDRSQYPGLTADDAVVACGITERKHGSRWHNILSLALALANKRLPDQVRASRVIFRAALKEFRNQSNEGEAA